MTSTPLIQNTPHARSRYKHFCSISTRWGDNDIYGHVNNVVYYSWFDTAVNTYLIAQSALDIHHGSVIGLVVETHCNYFAPLSFPQIVDVGLHVTHMGKTSVRYDIGLFAKDQPVAAAQGHFVHVYVDKSSRRPVPLSTSFKTTLEKLL